jgi:dipeptidyl aminopeptidase/acylaminoacyl peptidase
MSGWAAAVLILSALLVHVDAPARELALVPPDGRVIPSPDGRHVAVLRLAADGTRVDRLPVESDAASTHWHALGAWITALHWTRAGELVATVEQAAPGTRSVVRLRRAVDGVPVAPPRPADGVCGLAADGSVSTFRRHADHVVIDAIGVDRMVTLDRLPAGTRWAACDGAHRPFVIVRETAQGRLGWLVRSVHGGQRVRALFGDRPFDSVRFVGLLPNGDAAAFLLDEVPSRQGRTGRRAAVVMVDRDGRERWREALSGDAAAAWLDGEGRTVAWLPARPDASWVIPGRIPEWVEDDRRPAAPDLQPVAIGGPALLRSPDGQGRVRLGVATPGDPGIGWFAIKPSSPRVGNHRISSFDAEAPDGSRVPGYLVDPGDDIPRRGVLLYVHGGPRHHLDRSALDFATAWVDVGFQVVAPNFRGSTGHGYAHLARGNGAWGTGIPDDLAAVVRHLRHEKRIPAMPVVAVGGSFGGYAAMVLAARHPDLVAGVVATVAPVDLATFVRDTIRHDAALAPSLREMLASASPAELAAISPVNRPPPAGQPVLLFFGEDDPMVTVRQRVLALRAFSRACVDAHVVSIAGEGHGWRTAEAQALWAGEVAAFLAAVADGRRYEPAPTSWPSAVRARVEAAAASNRRCHP